MKQRNLHRSSILTFHFLRNAFLLTLSVFFLPALLLLGSAQAADTSFEAGAASSWETPASSDAADASASPQPDTSETDTSAASKQGKPTTNAPIPAAAASAQTLTVLVGDKVQTMGLEDYLWGVVAAEMPATFEQEALNAQAIAARTYTLYRMASPSPNHSKASICTDSGCCQAWVSYSDRLKGWEKSKRSEYSKKITTAIQKTQGLAMFYQDKPIMAAFHAASAGVTKSAKTVWGKDVPYPQSVSSPETKQQVPKYYSVVTVSKAKFCEALRITYPNLTLPQDPSNWFGKVIYDGSGLPHAIRIGSQTVPTATLRTLFGLRSPSVTAEWDGKQVRFYVTGYGHGVGMSQYGANAMAKQGKNAQQILRHYYTGVKIHKFQ